MEPYRSIRPPPDIDGPRRWHVRCLVRPPCSATTSSCERSGRLGLTVSRGSSGAPRGWNGRASWSSPAAGRGERQTGLTLWRAASRARTAGQGRGHTTVGIASRGVPRRGLARNDRELSPRGPLISTRRSRAPSHPRVVRGAGHGRGTPRAAIALLRRIPAEWRADLSPARRWCYAGSDTPGPRGDVLCTRFARIHFTVIHPLHALSKR